MKLAFCTCVTGDHLHFAQATFESLKKTFNGESNCYSLVVDDNFDSASFEKAFNLLVLDEINLSQYGSQLSKLKEEKLSSHFRWMLKPILLKHLLDKYDSVFWLDPDLYFYNDISHVTSKLGEFEAVVNPHWRSFDPYVNKNALFKFFYHGIFNGGFLGVNRQAIGLLNSWIDMMLWNLKDSASMGLFVDQGYLSLFPLMTEKTYIMRDRGCNISSWNRDECKRIKKDNEVLINAKYSIKFIHFVPDAVKGIISRGDPLLRPHLKKYVDHLIKINPEMSTLKSVSVEKINKKLRKY